MTEVFSKKLFEEYWAEYAQRLIAGTVQMNRGNYMAIACNLNAFSLRVACLPKASTILCSASDRKEVVFEICQSIWGITPEQWLQKENDWLALSRKELGLKETSGKDKVSDVVSSEILVRLVATSRYIAWVDIDNNMSPQEKELATSQAVLATNLFLATAVAKGYARYLRLGNVSVYKDLKDNGIVFGNSGSKYLPYPQESLPYLFSLLHLTRTLPGAYK